MNLNQLTSNEVYVTNEDLKSFAEEKAYNTVYLLQSYKDVLVKKVWEIVAATSYKIQSFRVNYYGDKLFFYQNLSRKEGEIVLSQT